MFCLLPKQSLEQYLHVTLVNRVLHSWVELESQHLRTCQDLSDYYRNPYRNAQTNSGHEPMPSQRTDTPHNAQLHWQQLLLDNGHVCSEIVAMPWQQTLYLGLLDLLPDNFGLFAPLDTNSAMNFVDLLVKGTLERLTELANDAGCKNIVTTIYNPNLSNLFARHGFQKDPDGPGIIGLPLPARFLKRLSNQY